MWATTGSSRTASDSGGGRRVTAQDRRVSEDERRDAAVSTEPQHGMTTRTPRTSQRVRQLQTHILLLRALDRYEQRTHGSSCKARRDASSSKCATACTAGSLVTVCSGAMNAWAWMRTFFRLFRQFRASTGVPSINGRRAFARSLRHSGLALHSTVCALCTLSDCERGWCSALSAVTTSCERMCLCVCMCVCL